MATSRTHIANMALRHVGVSLTLANVDSVSDRRAAALACRDFIDQARDEVLRDFDWPFARRVSPAAGLVVFEEEPTTEWLYSYRLPAEALAVRRVINGTTTRVETLASRTPLSLLGDEAGPLLYTDYASSESDPLRVVYTARIETVTLWPVDAAQAWALLLGGYIAPSLTEGDELKLGERALAKYAWRSSTAKANAANEEVPDQPGDGSLVTARY
jgi:hypothetical protein